MKKMNHKDIPLYFISHSPTDIKSCKKKVQLRNEKYGCMQDILIIFYIGREFDEWYE